MAMFVFLSFLNTPIARADQQIGSVLEASDAADSDNFGRSVSLSSDGSVLAVGAASWEGATGSNRGGVYIYDWSGSAWVQRGEVLEASDAADSDRFGISVSLSSDGSVLVVGTISWEGSISNQGGVYIYDWSGSAWVQRGSVLTASDAATSDQYGISTSLSSDGNILVVGATGWVDASGSWRGGVYIYDRNGDSWTQRGAVLQSSDIADNDFFGQTVSLSSDGSILAVGANGWEGTVGSGRGGVYIYDWNGSAWVQRGAVLEASDAADSDVFSYVSLSSDGSILAVGAAGWEGTVNNQGGVYLYDWNGSDWVQRGSILTASDAADTDRFGEAISLSSDGSVLAVGMYRWESTGTDRGGVYTYDLATPSVSLDTLDSLTNTSVILTGTATDEWGTIDSVEFQLDGGSWESCTSDDGTFDEDSEPFSCTIGIPTDGTHTVLVRTTDNHTNVSESASATFTFDSENPSRRLSDTRLTSSSAKEKIDTASNHYTQEKRPTLKGTKTDAANGTVTIFGKTRKGGTKTIGTTDISSDGSWSYRLPKEKSGTERYALTYTDQAGNVSTRSSWFTVIRDTQDPTFSDLPLTITLRRGDKISFPAMDDETKIDKYTVKLSPAMKTSRKQQEDFYIVPTRIQDGTYVLTVSAYDKAGNRARKSILVTVRGEI